MSIAAFLHFKYVNSQSLRLFFLSYTLHNPYNGNGFLQTPQLSLLSTASGTLSLHAVPNLGCACRRSANSLGFTACATQGQGNHSILRYLQEHPVPVRGRSVGCTTHRRICEAPRCKKITHLQNHKPYFFNAP